MKPIIPFALLGALLAVGVAPAAETVPVGYETLAINTGFNFVAPRLHPTVKIAGNLEAVTATTAQDTSAGVDFVTTLGTSGASGTYILEINDGSGVIQEVTTWTADTINAADLNGVTAPVGYSVRPSATLASMFGLTNQSGLAAGNGSSAGADQVWLWNGTGWTKHYYDNFAPPTFASGGWVNVDTATAVDANAINLVYSDALAIVSAAGQDVTVAGEVKTGATELTLATGFNFVGSVAPAGATVATAYGASNAAGLTAGNGSSAGADQVWIFNGTAWNKYYYDNFAPPTFASGGWVNVDTASAADSTLLNLPSGYAIVAASPKSITQGVPGYYNDL
jgi:hypothetical protein